MNLGLVEKIANAVLYEGYILYPYRASAVKNRQRWNFGALYPRAFSEAQGQTGEGVDAWTMQTECLVSASRNATVAVRVRFLHLLEREVSVPIADCGLRIVMRMSLKVALLILNSVRLNRLKSMGRYIKAGRKPLSVM